MKGFIRQRGDAWELRVYLGADPVTGKQRYATRTVRAGKREAQRVLNEMITEAERGLAVRSNATVALGTDSVPASAWTNPSHYIPSWSHPDRHLWWREHDQFERFQ